MKRFQALSYWVAALSISGMIYRYSLDSTSAEDKNEKGLAPSQVVSERLNLSEVIKNRYHFSDEQMQKMHDQGLDSVEIIKTAQLAESSKKPLNEVLKMRLQENQSWGMIAGDLGVDKALAEQAVVKILEEVAGFKKQQPSSREPARLNQRKPE